MCGVAADTGDATTLEVHLQTTTDATVRTDRTPALDCRWIQCAVYHGYHAACAIATFERADAGRNVDGPDST